MKIKGFETFSLVNYPGEACCVIFLQGCNFKCGFCYNPQLVLREEPQTYEQKEILDFLKKRKGKLTGICITGGEPLLTIEEDFLAKIKRLGYKIKIDTNGSNPEKLKSLIDNNLVDYIAMDIKGSPEDYEKITNRKIIIKNIEDSIKLISKFPNHEFRTTILKRFHNEENIKKTLEWIYKLINKKIENYSLQGFKNVGNFIDNDFKNEENTSKEFLDKLRNIAKKYCKNVIIKD